MTAKRYAPTDVRVLAVHQENGGCGTPHELPDASAPRDERFVDCAPCATWIDAHPQLGWANHPGGVKMTCDEIAQTDRDEKEAKRVGAQHLIEQLIGARGALGAAPVQPQSLIEQILALGPQIQALGPEQKAAMLALLGFAPTPQLDAAPVVPTVESTVEQAADTDPVAPKSKGGRPRKATAAAAA